MGRKHKRQHRAEKSSSNEPPLKLVLKVGKDGASSSIAIPQESILPPKKDPEVDSTPETGKRKRGRRKKKHEEKRTESDYTGSETVETGEETTAEEMTAEEEEPAAEPEAMEAEAMEAEETASQVTLSQEPSQDPPADETQQPEPEQAADKEETDEKSASMPFKKLYLSQPAEKKKSPKVSRGKEIKIKGLSLDGKDPLTKVLESLYTSLEKKDGERFFAHPVTDLIAPGYSTIIPYPMDFSTMKKKIKEKRYLFIDEYQEDFTLMCNNCMTYNQPETIYYKAAKRLLAAGQKIMSKERLAAVKRAFHYEEDAQDIAKLRRQRRSESSIGDVSEAGESESMITEDVPEGPSTTLGNPEGDEDNVTSKEAEHVINEVLAAAKEAKDRLTTKRPNSKMGFLRMDKDGTTTLNFVNPSNIAHPYDKQAVNLGMLTNKLAHGTGSLPGFREDKRNKANPITYLYYGPFSSYAPKYDSTFSNLSKEESDLLYSTYGDELGNQYAQSIQAYTKDCDNYVTRMVDELLDTLTHGEHSKTMATINENHREKDTPPEQSTNPGTDANVNGGEPVDPNAGVKTADQPPPGFNMESLKSLANLGIDMSFLPAVANDLKAQGVTLPEEPQDVSSQLEATSDLIQQLAKTQNHRLSQKPPIHLQYVPGPTESENSLADSVNSHLQSLIAKVKPGDVVSAKAVRGAMGITENQPPVFEEPETIEILDDDPSDSGPSKELLDLLDSPQTGNRSPDVVEIS